MRFVDAGATVWPMIARLRGLASLPTPRPTLGDVLLAAIVLLVTIGGMLTFAEAGLGTRRPDMLVYCVLAVQAAALAFRRVVPWGAYAVAGVTTVIYSVLGYPGQVSGLAVLIAIYTVATLLPLRKVIVAGAFYEVGMVSSVIPYYPAPEQLAELIGTVIFNTVILVLALVVGVTIRTRRAYVTELEKRASLLEREREEQARLAVALERGRIARELHDEVAHALTVVVVQADAAERMVESDPQRAADALRTIATTGREALADMRSLLTGLRDTDVETQLEPQPGVADLPALADRLAEAGLPVELSVQGEPRSLPAIVELSVYRIVQEALTNALRHAGPARARVILRYEPDALELRVSDDGKGGARTDVATDEPVTGHGLIGMRERVAIFAGELRAGPRPEGGFAVEARIPLQADPA